MHTGHRKSHFKRTQYWKHGSVKGQGMHAVEPLKLNKYVALNCQMHEALIFKLSSTREKPETDFSRKKALPALMHLPWSSSVFVFQHPLERVCTVVFTKAVCHFGTQCYLQKALLLLTWKIYIWDFILRVCCVVQTWSVHSFSSFWALRVKVCSAVCKTSQLIAGCIALVSNEQIFSRFSPQWTWAQLGHQNVLLSS